MRNRAGLSGKRILIVEDEQDLRSALSEIFADEGAEVEVAQSGNQAYQILISRPPFDLVLSDIRMPDGDGISLLKQMNGGMERLPRFIFVSAFSDLTLSQAKELGAITIVQKPFSISDLLSVIYSVIANEETVSQA